jgi:hypothetical protein
MSYLAETFHHLTPSSSSSNKPNTNAEGQPQNLPKGDHVKQDLNDPDLTGNPSQSALEQNQRGPGSSDRAQASMLEEARQAMGFGGGGTAAGAGSGDRIVPGGSGEKLVGK